MHSLCVLVAHLVKKICLYSGDLGSIPGWEKSPGEGNGNPLQYSCLKNPMDRRAWWATVHRVTKSHTGLKQLRTDGKDDDKGCEREGFRQRNTNSLILQTE